MTATPHSGSEARPVDELFDGPIDIVGDVHGELGALESLLRKLGYDDRGRHAEGRRLVFVGDLVDRGPDSPGVLRAVVRMVETGRAQCVLGNHELNALRDDPKRQRPGEGWWYGRDDPHHDSVPVDEGEKQSSFAPFLRQLPAALERSDLRVVHACWHSEAIDTLRESESALTCFQREQERLGPELEGLADAARVALADAGVSLKRRWDKSQPLEYVPELARYETHKQMGNAAKVVTSGFEQPAGKSFYVAAKWRVVERVRWWERYQDVPVVVGHYWRRYAAQQGDASDLEFDLFGETPADAWLGEARRVMCVDYSAGYRFRERLRGTSHRGFEHCLGALRVPDWQLVFDDGRTSLELPPPGEPTQREQKIEKQGKIEKNE